MGKKNNKNQLCKQCFEMIRRYQDALLDIDLRLQLLADLAISCSSSIDYCDTLAGLGAEINEGLHRYRIARHYFFDGDHKCNDEVLLQTELVRIKGRTEDIQDENNCSTELSDG